MEKREELYRGKAKSVYKTDDADLLILLFRNDTSAFDGKRIEQLDRKGMVKNKFYAFIIQKLEAAGVPTQFYKLLGDNRSEDHTSELQSLMRISYAVFSLKKQTIIQLHTHSNTAR